jgi:hypothetical protein
MTYFRGRMIAAHEPKNPSVEESPGSRKQGAQRKLGTGSGRLELGQ